MTINENEIGFFYYEYLERIPRLYFAYEDGLDEYCCERTVKELPPESERDTNFVDIILDASYKILKEMNLEGAPEETLQISFEDVWESPVFSVEFSNGGNILSFDMAVNRPLVEKEFIFKDGKYRAMTFYRLSGFSTEDENDQKLLGEFMEQLVVKLPLNDS